MVYIVELRTITWVRAVLFQLLNLPKFVYADASSQMTARIFLEFRFDGRAFVDREWTSGTKAAS